MKSKKWLLILLIIPMLLFTGCFDNGLKVVVQGKITAMKYHSVGWSGIDTVYDTTFDNGTTYMIRSDDFKQYSISLGDIVKLELHEIGGGGFYYIYQKDIVEG
jgi:hypothetical protein